MKPKLSSTISVVKISDSILEFFKTNTRQQLRIKVEDDAIMNIVLSLDGSKTVEEIAIEHDVKKQDLDKLLKYLETNGILDAVGEKTDFVEYERFRRPIHFLSEYASSHNELVNIWNSIRNSRVLIIGLGAVGSWVACNLCQSGVNNFILMDADVVEITNIHRQFGYRESDIGRLKTDALEEKLKEYNPAVNVIKENIYLDSNSLHKLDNISIDLIVNCADKPNVDTTSLWVGEYSMERNIPHIVGGGYNMHLSLIGQTVIPGQSACVKCFEKKLEEENRIDSSKVKKLNVKNRKVGSFAPMCTMIASMVGMEAIKVLSKKIAPSNVNRRGEFNIYTMDISYKAYERRADCAWCGKKGKYYCM